MAASNGTLFLDEVAELPLDQQPALLRALQERRIRPVGADREQPVNARVVAATHAQLEDLVVTGTFRADLYARLAVFPVRLPGLAECREDILSIFENAVGDECPPLTQEAAEALLRYDWPYNIRELQHAAANLRLLAPAVEAIDLSLLPSAVQRVMRPPAPTSESALAQVTPTRLAQLLDRHHGNLASAARELGVSRQKLYRLLESAGVKVREDRST